MKRTISLITTIFLLALLINLPYSQAQSEGALATAIELSLSQTRGEAELLTEDGPDTMIVANARVVEQPDIKFVAYTVKILDTASETIHTYWYDQDLRAISEAEAFRRRATAYEEKYGRLSPGLHALLSERDSGQLIPVAIWAEQPPETASAPTSYPYTIYLPVVIGGVGSSVERISQFLIQRGYAVDYTGQGVPVVYSEIPSSIILELQSQSYVAAIYPQEEGHSMLYSAARTSAAPWTWIRGITGQGVQVAVLENNGVAFDNPFLNGWQYHISWWPRVGNHATRVAGVIASTHDIERGIGPGVEILSANALNFWEVSVVAAADWAIARGAHIINASFGTICGNREITSLDKYFDWVVWHKKKTVVVSSGNVRPECPANRNVSSPGKGYNVITVGSKDDMNTAETEGDVADDRFSVFSQYVDPVTASENRLKPEVVATGERIVTTAQASPWIEAFEVAGTSFSAPIVAGQAALMMQRRHWLREAPEAVKAGIMATARWTLLWDDVNPNEYASMEKMGVGAIDTTAADNSLINGRIQSLHLRQTDFSNNHYDLHFDGLAGQRIRVIIVWNSHPSNRILNWILHDRLETDFDLTVRSPSGQIFGSYADESNYEIIEFMAPETGTYRARIHLSRWDDADIEERIGFAWYSGLPLP
jgi:subtilisin family serine protease